MSSSFLHSNHSQEVIPRDEIDWGDTSDEDGQGGHHAEGEPPPQQPAAAGLGTAIGKASGGAGDEGAEEDEDEAPVLDIQALAKVMETLPLRVAKDFGGTTYKGTVCEFSSPFFKVVFDDGYKEEWKLWEVKEGVVLFLKQEMPFRVAMNFEDEMFRASVEGIHESRTVVKFDDGDVGSISIPAALRDVEEVREGVRALRRWERAGRRRRRRRRGRGE